MRISARSALPTVAVAVGDALRRHGLRGVLTGGACASLHSRGAYVSRDVDLVLPQETLSSAVDEAMHSVGFSRDGSQYVHPTCRFYVEFPAGPLAIGADDRVRPILVRRGASSTWSLSATDSCRDRLAAFYHWRDRQAVRVAVLIALRNRVRMSDIRQWSESEGALSKFEEFQRILGQARSKRKSRQR